MRALISSSTPRLASDTFSASLSSSMRPQGPAAAPPKASLYSLEPVYREAVPTSGPLASSKFRTDRIGHSKRPLSKYRYLDTAGTCLSQNSAHPSGFCPIARVAPVLTPVFARSRALTPLVRPRQAPTWCTPARGTGGFDRFVSIQKLGDLTVNERRRERIRAMRRNRQ